MWTSIVLRDMASIDLNNFLKFLFSFVSFFPSSFTSCRPLQWPASSLASSDLTLLKVSLASHQGGQAIDRGRRKKKNEKKKRKKNLIFLKKLQKNFTLAPMASEF